MKVSVSKLKTFYIVTMGLVVVLVILNAVVVEESHARLIVMGLCLILVVLCGFFAFQPAVDALKQYQADKFVDENLDENKNSLTEAPVPPLIDAQLIRNSADFQAIEAEKKRLTQALEQNEKQVALMQQQLNELKTQIETLTKENLEKSTTVAENDSGAIEPNIEKQTEVPSTQEVVLHAELKRLEAELANAFSENQQLHTKVTSLQQEYEATLKEVQRLHEFVAQANSFPTTPPTPEIEPIELETSEKPTDAEMMTTVWRNLSLPAMRVSSLGEILFLNTAAENLLGKSQLELIGSNVLQTILRGGAANGFGSDTQATEELLNELCSKTQTYVTEWKNADGLNCQLALYVSAFANFDYTEAEAKQREFLVVGVPLPDSHLDTKNNGNQPDINISNNDMEIVDSVVPINELSATNQLDPVVEARLLAQDEALTLLAKNEIISSGDMNAILVKVTELLANTLGVERASIWLLDEAQTKITCLDLYQRSINEHTKGLELLAKDFPAYFTELRTENKIIAEFARSHPATHEFTEHYLTVFDIHSMLDVPIRLRGKMIGVICNEMVGSARPWLLDEQIFVSRVADLVSLAIETKQRKQAIERLKVQESEMQKLNNELQALLAHRTQSFEDLKSTQNQLVHTEKMATLGTLIAGVAHEINTPLGAIGAASTNLNKALPLVMSKLPQFFKKLEPQHEDLFFKMVERSLSTNSLSSREERQYRKQVSEQLQNLGVAETNSLAKELVKIGLIDNLEEFLPIFNLPNCDEFIDLAYSIGKLRVNIENIGLAVAKTMKIVFALKSYSRRNSFEEMEIANIIQNIETVLVIFHNQFKYGVDVVTDFEPGISPIMCYPDELSQVWTNIVHNSLQAMKNSGRMDISVKLEGSYIVSRFTDNGPGIPENILSRIFDPFFTTKAEGEGSGLGLDICRKIVEKHKGKITVDSVPGKTTFTVYIPTNLANEPRQDKKA